MSPTTSTALRLPTPPAPPAAVPLSFPTPPAPPAAVPLSFPTPPTPPAAIALSYRDRAVLRAVAAGRCTVAAGSLVVDGLCLSDQFVGPRLTKAGLIAAAAGAARLTASGQALLEAA